MKSPGISDKSFAKLKFIGFFSAAVLLCVIILSSFWGPIPSTPPQEIREVTSQNESEAQQLLMIDNMLHIKWMQLEQLYDEHALLLSDRSRNDNTNQAGKQIMEAEVLYAKVLDSVSANNPNSPIIRKIDSTVNSFRATLQNRQALNSNITEIALRNISKAGNVNVEEKKIQDQKLNGMQNDLMAKNDIITKLQTEVSAASAMRNSLSVNEQKVLQLQKDLQAKTDMITKLQSQVNAASTKNTGNAAIEQKVRQLQNDVQAKTDMIAKLESQLKASPVKNSSSGDDQKLRELQKDLQAKTAMIAKLQSQVKSMPAITPANGSQSSKDIKKITDELEFLKWALRSEVSSNHALTNNITQLKQANANLTNQLKEK